MSKTNTVDVASGPGKAFIYLIKGKSVQINRESSAGIVNDGRPGKRTGSDGHLCYLLSGPGCEGWQLLSSGSSGGYGTLRGNGGPAS